MIIELIQSYPRISIIVISLAVSLFITIVNYFLLNKERMRELKAKQKEINQKIKAESDASKKLALSNEMMKHTMETMRHSLKPMIITFVPLLLVFGLIRNIFSETSIGGQWLWYYIIAAIVGSIIFKKLFKVP